MRLSLCILMFLAFSVACKPQRSATVVIEPALATLIPSDTTMLAGVHMEPLRATQLYQKYITQQKFPALDKFAKETGLDPRSDIWEFLITTNGKDALVMARGKFTPDGMEPRLERQGLKRIGYKGYTLLGDEQSAVFFMNASTGVAGSTRALKNVIDQRGHSGGIPPSLSGLVNALPSTNQIWFAGNVAGRLAELNFRDDGNLGNLARFAQSLQTVAGGVDAQNGIKVHADAHSSNEIDAKHLNEALRGAIGLGRLSTPDDRPDMLRIYDGIHVAQDKQNVAINAEFSNDQLEYLIKMATSLGAGSHPPGF